VAKYDEMNFRDKLENYINEVRQAYEVYYNALSMYGEEYIEHEFRDKDIKEILKKRIRLLKKTKEASLGYMIPIGLLGTYGD